MKRNFGQKGFTLVELAIVMVIIGLMLGAVLKGQAMIDDAKQKRLMNDLQGITAAYFTYYDRYNALPGDDVSTHGWSGVVAGTGNGFIDGVNATNGTEGHEFWQALRYAGLLSGNPAATGAAHLQNHPFGSTYQVENRPFAGIGTKNYIQVTALEGTIAERVDIKFDDGIYNTGTVAASGEYTSNTVNLYYGL